jgi:CheY-like chemotaxis protein
MNILIADDDRVLCQVMSVRLRKAGYKVTAVFDAMQAIMIAMKTVPDAVLLDMNMPAGTGLQVLRQLKHSIRTSHIPIIVITGSLDPDVAGAVTSLGADAFLSKPPDFEQLEIMLQRLLNDRADINSSCRKTVGTASCGTRDLEVIRRNVIRRR